MINFLNNDFFVNKEPPTLPISIQKAVSKVEGKYFVNDHRDPGGPTKFGWTLKTYQSLVNNKATISTIKNLTAPEAMRQYYVHFWKPYGAYRINNMDLSTSLFLAQINIGPKRPNVLIQTLTNDFCYSKKELKEDGIIGPLSAQRINDCSHLWPGFPYILYYMYSKSKHIADVWRWARRGLINRIFYGLHL